MKLRNSAWSTLTTLVLCGAMSIACDSDDDDMGTGSGTDSAGDGATSGADDAADEGGEGGSDSVGDEGGEGGETTASTSAGETGGGTDSGGSDTAGTDSAGTDSGGTDSGGTDTGAIENCEDLLAAFWVEADAIQSCESDEQCGQVLQGTSCGCTRDWVARLDANTDAFYGLIELAGEMQCELPLVSTCDCPAAEGFACVDGTCTWNYL